MRQKLKRALSVLSAIAMSIGAIPAVEIPTFAVDTAASTILYGDINGDSAINSTDTTELTKAINNKTASSLKNADLNGDGKVNNSDALILKQYVSGEIKYFPVGDVYEEGVSFVTRGEWIHNLVTTFSMSVDDTSTMTTYYTDLSGNQYQNDIELAANFGVFEVEGNTFSPDSIVTREFAAHTANFCVGYLNEGSANFTDADDIYYEDDAVVSVEKNWFTLVENQFRPNLYMKSTESTVIIKDLNNAINAATVNEKAKQTVEYSDSVIQLDPSVKAEQTGDTVTINDEDVAIIDGDIFVVNIDGTDHMYKASSVSIGKNGEIIAKVEDAPLEESLSTVNIQGYGEVDYNNITYYDNTAVQTYSNTQNITLPNDYFIAANENSVSLSKTIDLGGNKVTVSGSINNIRPEYKLQYDGKKVESFYLNVNADANLTAKTSGSFSSTKSKEIRIASVPVACGGVLTTNVAVYVTVSLSGEITVSYGWDIAGGISYTANGGWRATKNFHKKSFTLDAKASESVAVKAAIEAKVATAKIAELYVMAGEKGNIEAKKREDGTECATLKAYVFAEVGANANLFGKTFSKSWEFIDEGNSPVKITKHWENDVLVDKCKYDGTSSGTTGSTVKKKKVNYAEYSNYGTEFDGIITASTSADSKSDGSVTRWSGDITLSKDTEVYGDLLLTTYKTYENGKEVTKSFSSLDLDGHSLTVYGDIIQNLGTITINNGRLSVYGDYIMQNVTVNNIGETVYESCRAELIIENQYDKVNIGGNFTTHNLNGDVSLYQGTLSIGGNIWSDGGIRAGNVHKTVLNGSGTQKIYFAKKPSSYPPEFNELEVTNPSARTIIFDGDLRVRKFVSDINIKADDLNLYYFDLNKQNVTINGDVTVWCQTLDLNGGSLNIKGNVLQIFGTIECNNGTLNVTGNYTMENTTTNNVGEVVYEMCEAKLKMNNQYDKVNISGNFTTHNLLDQAVILKQGTLFIGGDIWSDKGIWALDFVHKTVLNGSGTQKIYLAKNSSSPSNFNELEVTNPSARTIIFDGDLRVRKFVSDINIKADDLNLYYFDLNKQNVTINGDVTVWCQTLDLNGGSLNIKGNVLQGNGTIKCNNGTLNVTGNYTMENTTTNNVGETVYERCHAKLEMNNQYDKVNISGNFTTHNLYSENVSLYQGTLSIGGDIWSDKGIVATSVHKTVLNGSGTQKIYLAKNSSSPSNFNELEVTNPSARTIIFSGDLSVKKFVSDINIKSDDLNLCYFDLNRQNVTINGDVTVWGDTLNLNGGSLNIKGNILQSYGTIKCNNGTLDVTGNYTMENTTTNNVGETVYEGCYAKLEMKNQYDKVNIGGNFTTHNLNGDVSLYQGTLSIGGDIWSDRGISTPIGYDHKTVLTGDKKQSVTLNKSNKFNILELTQNKSNYTFNPEPCWYSLITIESGSGDVLGTTATTTTVTTTTTKSVITTRATTKLLTTTITTTKVNPVTTNTTKITTKPVATTTTKITTKPVTMTTTTTTNKPVVTTNTIQTTVIAKLGDLNGDDKTTVADIVEMQKFLVKTKKLTKEQWKLADMNSDGKVNVFDLIILKRRLLYS